MSRYRLDLYKISRVTCILKYAIQVAVSARRPNNGLLPFGASLDDDAYDKTPPGPSARTVTLSSTHACLQPRTGVSSSFTKPK